MNERMSIGSFPIELREAGQAAGLTEKSDVPTSDPNLAFPRTRFPKGCGRRAVQGTSVFPCCDRCVSGAPVVGFLFLRFSKRRFHGSHTEFN